MVFGPSTANGVLVELSGTTLTIGGGITIHGHSGVIGTFPNFPWGTPADVMVNNQGTISADVAGGVIQLMAMPFSNGGTVKSPAGIIDLAGIYGPTGAGMFESTGGSVRLSGMWENSGSTLLVDDSSGSLTLLGGVIHGGAVDTAGSARLVGLGGTLDGVTVNGQLDVPTDRAALVVTNGLTLNGTAYVGGTNGERGALIFAGTQTLGGSGEVVFGPSTANGVLVELSGTTLTIGGGITIHGHSGVIGTFPNFPWGTPADVMVNNQGTISADVAGGVIQLMAMPFSNGGTVKSPAGIIDLAGIYGPTGAGVFESTGGSVRLSGMWENSGSTLLVDDSSGSLTLLGGVIHGGAVDTAGSARLVGLGGTLDGVTVNGQLDVPTDRAALVVTNGLTLNGTAYVGGTNGERGALLFAGTQTLGGSGEVVFGPSTANGVLVELSGTTLTIGGGITIHGHSGVVGTFPGNPWFTPGDVMVNNQGTISADVAGGVIQLMAMPFSNGGTVKSPAGIIDLAGIYGPTGAGVFESAGGSVRLSGMWENSGSTLLVDDSSGSLTLLGGVIHGGAVDTAGSARLVGLGGTLDGVTVNGQLDVPTDRAALVVTNGLTLNGTAYVGGTNGERGALFFAGTQTLGGSGEVVFGPSTANGVLVELSGTTLTIGGGITIHGHSGVIGTFPNFPWGTPADVMVNNQGTISADVAGGVIQLMAMPFSNGGTVKSPAGIIDLAGIYGPTGAGVFESTGGSVRLSGMWENSGSTLLVDDSSGSLTLLGGVIHGGAVDTAGSARLVGLGGTLDGVTVNGQLELPIDGAALVVTNGLTLNGTAYVGGTNGERGALFFAGTQTLGGSGEVVFGPSTANGVLVELSGTTLTIGGGITIHGHSGVMGTFPGNPWFTPGDVMVNNQGTISADVAGGVIQLMAMPFSNGGTVKSPAGIIDLAGIYGPTGAGVFESTGGSVRLSGMWENSGSTLLVDDSSGSLDVAGWGYSWRNG